MKIEKQKKVLKWILGRAYRAKDHKEQLEKRLAHIRIEMNSPCMAVNYGFAPKSKKVGGGASDLPIKLIEIEEKIAEQIRVVGDAEKEIMEILDYIPINMIERQIMELRHLDMMSWYEISDAIYMTRQNCYRKYKNALGNLLQIPAVLEIIEKKEKEYDDWILYAKK